MRLATVAVALALLAAAVATARADERQEACKKDMNARIQICADSCTTRALAAASDYVDTNHNVKFGCLKGCALREITTMKACREGGSGGDIETNR